MIMISTLFLLLVLIGYYIGLMESIGLLLLLLGFALLSLVYSIFFRPRTKVDSFEEHLRSVSEKVEKWPRP